MKSRFLSFVTAFFILFPGATSATTIKTETPVLNPQTTEGLWAYYYDENVNYISMGQYVEEGDPYSDAEFQGYVSSDNGPWRKYDTDSWGSSFYSDDDAPTVHIFQTYIIPSEDRTVYFRASGDDGVSIFIDDSLVLGGTYWTGPVTSSNFDLETGTPYKLAYIGSNCGSDQFAWNFKMYYEDGTWAGRISEAPGITMNAAPVPIPGTVWLLGSSLLGLVAIRSRYQKKISY